MSADRPSDRERIAASSFWQSVDEGMLDTLLAKGEIVELAAGEPLFEAGDAWQERIHVHLEGDLEQVSGRGDERRADPGDVLGLANYLDGADYRSTARAVSDCRVLALPAALVKRLEQESAGFYEAINRALAARMRKARQVRESVRGTLARPVHQFMRTGLTTCKRDTTIAEAAATLERRQIGSLGVLDDDGRLFGLLTPLGLLRAITTGAGGPDDPVDKSACQEPWSVAPDTPLWQVEDIQQRHQVKYVVVVDDDNTPIGMMSQTDLVRALATPPQTLDADIAAAEDVDTLIELRTRVPVTARRVRETHRSAGTAVRALTEAHLAIQHRLVELTLAAMESDGHGRPPIRFALIIMGSGGRGEMLLHPDQDNGLILEDDADDETRKWFAEFADRFNTDLDRIGYPLCPGGIMACRPDFCHTLQEWKDRVSGLVRNPKAAGARWSTIVFDFSTQYGDDRLTVELRNHVNREMQRGKGLLKLMAEDDAEGRPPLGLFNRLLTRTHEGEETIDIKRNGLRIITDAARIYALARGINPVSTHERLTALSRLGVIDRDFVESLRLAFEELQDLLLSHQLDQVERGRTPDPLLRIDRLTSHDRERLRVSLRAARRMQDRLQGHFGVGGGF